MPKGPTVAERPGFLENSIIVACHPDDELLWFASILPRVDQVLLIYEDYWPDPELGAARARAVANHPHPSVRTLRLPEVATYGAGRWADAAIDDVGIDFGRAAALRDAKQAVLGLAGRRRAPAGGLARRYRANFASLCSHLRESLRADMNVFTHNAWGEYGHEDHVQLHRALCALRDEMGFRLWTSNYVTERSLPLAMRYFKTRPEPGITLPVDVAHAERVADCYREAGCWTWADDWTWFPTETFRQAPHAPSDAGGQAHLAGLNFFRIGT